MSVTICGCKMLSAIPSNEWTAQWLSSIVPVGYHAVSYYISRECCIASHTAQHNMLLWLLIELKANSPLSRLLWRCITVMLTLDTSTTDCDILNVNDSLNDGLTDRRTTSVLLVFRTLFCCRRLTRTYTSAHQQQCFNCSIGNSISFEIVKRPV